MLYIHIPYCRHKCVYCDFFSGGAAIADWDALTRALIAELQSRRDELPSPLTSIYIGGGTPSLMPGENFNQLIYGIKRLTGAEPLPNNLEFTIEVNPEDVSQEKIEAWKRGGVSRISLGIQSFDDRILRSLGRMHSGEDAARGLELLRREFRNVSADLMYGLPNQTAETFREDLDRLISLHPTHISVYSLMLEEGTALTQLSKEMRGLARQLPDEDTVVEMTKIAAQTLKSAGYLHYEISNFALPGYESRHNSGYWHGRPYLGIGPAAHSYDGRTIRRSNPWNLKGYLEFFGKKDVVNPSKPVSGNPGKPLNAPHRNTTLDDGIGNFYEGKFYEEEILSKTEILEEAIMLGLRTSRGIDIISLRQRLGGKCVEELVARAIEGEYAAYLEIGENHMRLANEDAVRLSDAIILSLIP